MVINLFDIIESIIIFIMSKKPVNKVSIIKSVEQLTLQAQKSLQSWLAQIKNLSKDIEINLPLKIKTNSRQQEFMIAYLHYYAEQYNHGRFKIEKKQEMMGHKELLSTCLFDLNNENQFIIGFRGGVIQQIIKLQAQKIKKLLQYLIILGKGFIAISQKQYKYSLQQIKRSISNTHRQYIYNMKEQKLKLIFCIGYEKIPIFSKERQISEFGFQIFIELQKILNSEEINKQMIQNELQNIQLSKNIQAKMLFLYEDIEIDEIKKAKQIEENRKRNILYFSFKQKTLEDKAIKKTDVPPFKRIKADKLSQIQYSFLYQNQIFCQKIQGKEKETQVIQVNQEYNLISSNDLTNQFYKLPKIKFKLTQQQQEAMLKEGNVIVIGRSGTGKTLLSILRMYLIQSFTKIFKAESIILKKKKEGVCPYFAFDKIFQDKNIFLTASPFLIDEIIKQYQDMSEQIKKQHQKICQPCKNYFKQNLQGNYSQPKDDIDQMLQRIQEREHFTYKIDGLQKNKCPGFFTTKKFIKMIDKGLKRPFFAERQIKKQQGTKQTIMINIYHENTYRSYDHYEEKLEIKFKNRLNNYNKLQLKNYKAIDKPLECIEVDFSYFSTVIWSVIKNKFDLNNKIINLKINPITVWTEICSIIKGSVKAHSTHFKCLSPKMYIQQSKNNFLQQKDKLEIYAIFEQYQLYKLNNDAFDMMDAINHILQQIQLNRYENQYIDYLFIDQVQDLTSSTIYLLSKMTKKNIFYCGDTAQAISKGVSFKFSEIKTMFNEKYCKNPIKKQIPKQQEHLTINFRSHNRILKFANYIISSLETLFPKTIDKLKKQQSDLFGPKNLIINNGDHELIYKILAIEDNNQIGQHHHDKNQQRKNNLQGDQIILVRNKNEKDKLLQLIKNQHILTAEEVKGLQYDDVVIYNFFSSSPCFDKWSLFDYLDFVQVWEDEKSFQNNLNKRSQQQGQDIQQLQLQKKFQLGYDKLKKSYLTYQLKVNPSIKQLELTVFNELCSQLKILYTLITRARSFVLIFDKNIPKWFNKFINSLNLAKFFEEDDDIDEIRMQLQQYRSRQNHKKYLNKQRIWRQEAIRMLARKNYDQAIVCFEKAKDPKSVKRVKAIQITKNVEDQLHAIKIQLSNPQKLSKQLFKLKRKRILEQKSKCDNQLIRAAEIYKQIQKFKEAAQIFQSCQVYHEAIECFDKLNNYEKMADCYYKINQFEQALKYYKLQQNTTKILDCLIKLQKWQQSFQILKVNKKTMKQKIIQNPQIQQKMQLCIASIMKSQLLCTQLVQNDIQFNKNFYNQKKEKEQQREIQGLLKKDKIQQEQSLISIVSTYNFFQINQLAKKMSEIVAKKVKLVEQIKDLKKKLDQKKQKQKQLLKSHQQLDQQRNRILVTPYLYEEQKFTNLNQAKLMQLQFKKHLDDLLGQIQDFQYLIDEKQNSLEEFCNDNENIQQSSVQIKKLLMLAQQQFKISIRQKLSKESLQLKTSNSIHNQTNDEQFDIMSQCDLSVDYSSSVDRNEYYKYRHQVYKIYLSQEIISDILMNVQQILSYVPLNELKQPILNYFDHRMMRRTIEEGIYTQDWSMRDVIKLFKNLQNLGVENILMIICDYYSLHYHSVPVITQYILRFSRNFYCQRNIKQVAQINFEQLQQIKGKLSQFLVNTSKNTLQKNYIVKPTRQSSYNQSVAKILIQTLIIAGFYQNALYFCGQAQIFELSYIFMNYQLLLQQSIKKRKRFNNQNNNDKNQKKFRYYFFSQKQIGDANKHLSLTNIFTIQKLYFDFDKCSNTPMLSKNIDISQIQLNDQQINKCYNQIQERIANNYQKASYYQLQIEHIKKEMQNMRKKHDDYIQDANMQIRGFQNQIKKQTQPYYNLQKQIQNNINIIKDLQFYINKQGITLHRSSKAKKDLNRQVDLLQDDLQDFQSDNRDHSHEERKQYENLRRKFQNKSKQLEKALKEEKNIYQDLQKLQKEKKDRERYINNLEDQLKSYSINYKTLQTNIVVYKKQKQNATFQYNRQMQKRQKQRVQKQVFYRKWSSALNIKQEESKLYQEVLKEFKYSTVYLQNQKILTQIRQNMEKSSNLYEMTEFKFLYLYVNGKLDLSHQGTVNQFQKIFDKCRKIQNYNIRGQDICQIILFYLTFLFNQQFRRICMTFCRNKLKQRSSKTAQIDAHQRNKKAFYNRKKYYEEKLIAVNRNLSMKDIPLDKKANLLRDKQYLEQQVGNFQSKWDNEIHEMQIKGLTNLMDDPFQQINFLLSIPNQLKNLDQKTYKFMEILFGFFQCRIINNCDILSFLQGQYVFLQSDSIILRKMSQYGHNQFCYFFDCQNKIVLSKFELVRKTIMKYLQLEQQTIYSTYPQLKSKNITNKIEDKYISKNLLGYETKQRNQNLLNAYILANRSNKGQISSLYDLYLHNDLLTKAKRTKQEILQFYLKTQLREKQSFDFVLYQVKQLHNVEKVMNKMKIFNPKLMKEIKAKLQILQENKKQWINAERFNYKKVNYKIE